MLRACQRRVRRDVGAAPTTSDSSLRTLVFRQLLGLWGAILRGRVYHVSASSRRGREELKAMDIDVRTCHEVIMHCSP